jgi:hypothetical protein
MVSSGPGPWLQPLVTSLIGVIAAIIAIRAWLTSVAALHSAYRPVLRPVPTRKGRSGPEDLDWFLLKNIGRGPAVGVMLFEKRTEETLVAELDLVEPLGPRSTATNSEVQRVGRREFHLARGRRLEANATYRIIYQDIAGRWHETAFRYNQGHTFTVRYLGPRRWWSIPKGARSRGHVTTEAEFD